MAQAPRDRAAIGAIAIKGSQSQTLAAIARLVECLGGRANGPSPVLTILDLERGALPSAKEIADLQGPHLLLAGADTVSQLRFLSSHRPDLDVQTRPLTPLVLAQALERLSGAAAQGKASNDQVPGEFRGATIAVAEDIALNQHVIRGLLNQAGIRVILASNGKELLEMLAQHAVDLILMDIQMPQMDGYEASRLLRARGWQGPIIGLSAGVAQKEQERCLSAGMNDFLPKPIDFDELWGVLTRWLPPRWHDLAVESSAPWVNGSAPELCAAPGSAIDLLPMAEVLAADALSRSGIDAAEAIGRFLGNPSALANAVARFCDQHLEDANNIGGKWRLGDFQGAARIAHGLKGAAGAIGAGVVRHFSGAVETLPPGSAPELADMVISGLGQALGAIGNLSTARHVASRSGQQE